MATEEDREALERTVAEIEVLESIYGSDEEESQTYFRVLSMDALESARSLLASGDSSGSIPRLDIALQLPLCTERTTTTTLRCGMPAGYPISQPAIVSVEVPTLTRSLQDKLSRELTELAQQLVGEEAVMGLAQILQEIGADAVLEAAEKCGSPDLEESAATTSFSRQWLFMDHIKAESRRAQMIREATSLQVGGLIKPGYPGVCVVEGESRQVDQFVSWMKQIWIGRVAVRGEEVVSGRKLPSELTDLGDGKNLPNMGVLGSACRQAGLEEEFMEYIMQIRSS